MLCFTAEEAWAARFGDTDSVHLEVFPPLPADWRDGALAAKWETIRSIRRRITGPIEEQRKAGAMGSSLQAAVELRLNDDNLALLTEAEWTEIAIASAVHVQPDSDEPAATIALASWRQMRRCWRVLEEVGQQPNHPSLCARCADAVELRTGLPARRVTRAA